MAFGICTMPFDLPPTAYAILSGITFFLVVGRMFWDSFKDLFGDLIDLVIPAFISGLLIDHIHTSDEGKWQMALLLAGSVVCGIWVYFKLG